MKIKYKKAVAVYAGKDLFLVISESVHVYGAA